MEETRAKPDRVLLGILAVIAVLVVVAVVVVFTSGAPALRESGTPERVVQDYAAAVIAGDDDAATELLSTAWTKDCEPMDAGVTSQNLRLTLIDTNVHGETATVRVSVASGYSSGPFGGSGYEYEDQFQLERSGDGWLISSTPWEFMTCPRADAS
jgi:hypothetical protein